MLTAVLFTCEKYGYQTFRPPMQTVLTPYRQDMHLEAEKLLADVRECGLGLLTTSEITEFDALARDFLDRFGDCFTSPRLGVTDSDRTVEDFDREDFWEKYLKVRKALPKGSITNTISATLHVDRMNYGLPVNGWTASDLAATLIYAQTSLYRDSTSPGAAKSDEHNVVRLAAEACRLPGTDRDHIVMHAKPRHWCIATKGQLYKLELPLNLDASDYSVLADMVAGVLKEQTDAPTNLLPAMTAIDRPKAAHLRERLLEDKAAKRTIETMETSAGIIILDEGLPDQTGTEFQTRLLLGNGLDRWYGKTCYIVSGRNWYGVQLDHGSFNGARAERFLDLLVERSRQLHDALNAKGGNAPQKAKQSGFSVDRLDAPERRDSMESLLAAFRSSGQIEASFTYDGRLLKLPGMKRPTIAENLVVACQLVLACHRGGVPEMLVPVRRLDARGDSLDHVRAAFLNMRQLYEHYQLEGALDTVMVRRAKAEWRRWFRRGLRGTAIESRLAKFLNQVSLLAIRHPLLGHPLIAGRAAAPPVYLSLMPARYDAGSLIYSFLPVTPGEIAMSAYIGDEEVRIDVTSSKLDASDLVKEIAELMRQLSATAD